MRIPAQHTTVLHYVREAGLQDALVPFASVFAAQHGWYSSGNGSVAWPNAASAITDDFAKSLAFDNSIGPDTRVAVARISALMHTVAPGEVRRLFESEFNHNVWRALDSLDLTPYLEPGRPRIDILAILSQHAHLKAHFSATTALFLRDAALENQAELYTLDGGMDRLPRAMAKKLRRPPLLSAAVQRIERRDRDVLVHIASEQGVYTQTFDWAVCTVPFSALRHIELVGVSAEKLSLIHGLPYCPTMKVLLNCRQRFWEREATFVDGGASVLDGFVRQIYYPRPNPGYDGGVLLAAYATGADVRVLQEKSPEERIQFVCHQLARLHPELKSSDMIVSAACIDWNAEPWIRGGCSVPWNSSPEEPRGNLADQQLAEQAQLAAKPDGRLLFAGEHCSMYPAWMEGALDSALKAVATLQMEETA